MNTYGELIDKTTLRFERLLPGPIDRVWSYLVDGEKRAKWLCGGDTELKPGGKVSLEFENASLSKRPDIDPPEKYCHLPEQINFTGTVTEIDPPNLLAHTWEAAAEHSEVRYELSEEGDKVRLVVTHRKLPNNEELLGAAGGWHTHLDILCDVLDGEEPQPFWKVHTEHEAEYAARLDIEK